MRALKIGFVSLKIYDMIGKEVAVLADGFKQEGQYSVDFNAGNLASGLYIYELKVNDFSATKKMMLSSNNIQFASFFYVLKFIGVISLRCVFFKAHSHNKTI